MGRFAKNGLVGQKLLRKATDEDGHANQKYLPNNTKNLGRAPLWLKLQALHTMHATNCNYIRMANWHVSTVDLVLQHMLKQHPSKIILPNLASDDLCDALRCEFQRLSGTWL
jgi:hypothetical protein